MQHITQETKEEDLPKGVMSVSLLKHQVTFLLISVCSCYAYAGGPIHFHVLLCLEENSIGVDAFEGE